MQVKKSLLVAGAAATVGLTGLTGLGVASASSENTSDKGASSIIDKLVGKFNIDRNEVEEVFEEVRGEHEAEQAQRLEDKLDAAVEEGKLTEAQKEALLGKLAEFKNEREAERGQEDDMSKKEHLEHIEQKRSDLEAWAEEQGISTDLLKEILMPGHDEGRMHIRTPADLPDIDES